MTRNGFIKVAAREGKGVRDGEWPKGWRFDDSKPFTSDSLDTVMGWTKYDSLESFPDDIIRLHFWMEDAELYSFWFD